MRQRNWRFVITGVLFLALTIGFYFFMMTLAPKSTDPLGLMRIAGQASGFVGGVCVVLIIAGLVGKRKP